MSSMTDVTWIIIGNPVSFMRLHGKVTDGRIRNICFQSGNWQIGLCELVMPWYHFLGEIRVPMGVGGGVLTIPTGVTGILAPGSACVVGRAPDNARGELGGVGPPLMMPGSFLRCPAGRRHSTITTDCRLARRPQRKRATGGLSSRPRP